jgi:hypothetical protein
VSARSVPVAFYWFRLVINVNTELLTNPFQKVPRNPKLIGNTDTLLHTNLVLVLTWSHLSVDPANRQPSI